MSNLNHAKFILKSCAKEHRAFWKEVIKLVGRKNLHIELRSVHIMGEVLVRSPFFDSVELVRGPAFEERMLNTIKERVKRWRALFNNTQTLTYSDISHVLFNGFVVSKIFQPHMLMKLLNANKLSHLSPTEVSSIIEEAWITAEYNGSTSDLWGSVLEKFPVRGFQTEELPNIFTVYRAGSLNGMSWTLDREVAEWFSKRFDEDRPIHEMTIRKEDVLFYTNRRSEQEVVIIDSNRINESITSYPLAGNF